MVHFWCHHVVALTRSTVHHPGCRHIPASSKLLCRPDRERITYAALLRSSVVGLVDPRILMDSSNAHLEIESNLAGLRGGGNGAALGALGWRPTGICPSPANSPDGRVQPDPAGAGMNYLAFQAIAGRVSSTSVTRRAVRAFTVGSSWIEYRRQARLPPNGDGKFPLKSQARVPAKSRAAAVRRLLCPLSARLHTNQCFDVLCDRALIDGTPESQPTFGFTGLIVRSQPW